MHTPEAVQGTLSSFSIGILFCVLIIRALIADHWGENENAFFTTPDEAAKRSPSAVSGHVSSVWLLPRNQHDVAEAVITKLRHCSEVLSKDCTLPGLQRLHQKIHGFFGFEVDFFQFHIFPILPVWPVFSFTKAAARKNNATRVKGQ